MRDALRAGLLYAALAAALLHRLFLGEVLCGGADQHHWGPFRSQAPAEWRAHSHCLAGDLWRMQAPWQRYQRQAFKDGRFPAWNPHPGLGTPFHANGQTAVFLPVNWPYWFWDSDTIRGPQSAVRLWLAGFFLYLLLRRWDCGFGPAWLGGAAWMLAAFNIRWLQWSPATVALWLPALAWTLDRWATQPSARRFGVLLLATTVLQLCGHPETQFQAGVAAMAATTARLAGLGIGFRRASWLWLGGAAALALGALGAGIQLWPFLLQLPESIDMLERSHQQGEGHEAAAAWLFAQPFMLGSPRGWCSPQGRTNFMEACLTFGGLALAAAGAAMAAALARLPFAPQPARTVFWLAVGMALGVGITFETPLAAALRHTPVFEQLAAARWAMLTSFCGVLLAALGWEHALRSPAVRGLLAGFATLAAAAAWWALRPPGPAAFDRWPDAFAEGIPWRLSLLHPALRGAAVAAALTFGALACWAGWRRALALAILAEGFAAGWDLNVTAPPALAFPPAPPMLQAAVAAAGPGRLIAADEDLPPNISMDYAFRDVRVYDFPIPARAARVHRRLQWELGMMRIPAARLWPQGDAELAAFLRRTAVNAFYSNVVRPAWRVGDESWPQQVARGGQEAVYARQPPAPRVRVEAWRPATADEAFDHLFAAVGPAAVEDPPAGAVPIASARGLATLARDDPERVEIDVETPTGGLVTLADRWDHGWTATVDGAPAEALQVDCLLRGTLVPPGRHRIVWEYRAPGLRTGAGMTFAVLALATGLCLRAGRGGSA